MKRRVMTWLMALSMLLSAVAPGAAVLAEENDELFFPEIELELGTDSDTRAEDDSDLNKVKDDNAAAMESLGKTDWKAAAKKVSRTGEWREDLVNIAESQIGYQADNAGNVIYGSADADKSDDWTGLFVSWVAEQAGLTKKEFPRGESYKDFRRQMDKAHALKKISRANYPVSGDLAFIETKSQKLVGIIVYVANGYATIIHGDDNGRVTRTTYLVDSAEFKYYADLNVLMERAGIEIGKGGDVPEIPEGGVAAWTNTNAVYLRSEPTTACKSLTTVKKSGTAVLVTSAVLQEDGYIWYGVTYKSHVGYIRGDLLKLDMSAIPTGTPVPTAPPAPVVTPAPEPEEIPGCIVCVVAAQGVALPVDCCYEHLASMDRGEQVRFMNSLRTVDMMSFQLYIDCHAAHVSGGAAGLICLGGDCGEQAWSNPGSAHAPECPWYLPDTLVSQERVVNVEVREARGGQQITIVYEIYGATAYQWHEVKSILNADGSVTETDTALAGETAESITVTARDEVNTSYSYYCVATIVADGVPTEVVGKTTVLNVGNTPIVAQAILGEEINFTYDHPRASTYQWYVQADENAAPVAIAAENAAYSGAGDARLTFHATAENSGALYSCAALDAEGNVLGMSAYYAYTVSIYTQAPDATVCEGHDLCKYVAELANMTLEQRYIALNETWYVSASDVSAPAAEDCLAEYVMLHWYFCHQQTYPNLICTCTPTEGDRLVLHPYDDVHEAECPWYVAPAQTDAETQNTVIRADQAEFDLWAATATEEMIARAKTVPTLDHAVFEANGDNTYDLYIARYADPVGTVDAQGYLTYGSPAKVIGWVDFSTGTLYAMNNLPDSAPVRNAD